MYNIRIVITVLLVFCFTAAFAQPTPVQMKKLQGYFFSGSESMLKNGVNCFVVQKEQDFEKLFGKNRPDTPQFSKEWMLVLVMPATKKDIQLEFIKVSMKAGAFIEVYCDLNKLKGKLLTYETNPIVLCTIPKFKGIKTINFYEDRKRGLELIESVEVKK